MMKFKIGLFLVGLMVCILVGCETTSPGPYCYPFDSHGQFDPRTDTPVNQFFEDRE